MAYRDPVTGQIIGENGLPSASGDPSASAGDPTSSGGEAAASDTALASADAMTYTFRWLLAWAIVILLASLANRTRLGHAILYYLLALSLFFLIVTQYRWFAAALSPITGGALNG